MSIVTVPSTLDERTSEITRAIDRVITDHFGEDILVENNAESGWLSVRVDTDNINTTETILILSHVASKKDVRISINLELHRSVCSEFRFDGQLDFGPHYDEDSPLGSTGADYDRVFRALKCLRWAPALEALHKPYKNTVRIVNSLVYTDNEFGEDNYERVEKPFNEFSDPRYFIPEGASADLLATQVIVRSKETGNLILVKFFCTREAEVTTELLFFGGAQPELCGLEVTEETMRSAFHKLFESERATDMTLSQLRPELAYLRTHPALAMLYSGISDEKRNPEKVLKAEAAKLLAHMVPLMRQLFPCKELLQFRNDWDGPTTAAELAEFYEYDDMEMSAITTISCPTTACSICFELTLDSTGDTNTTVTWRGRHWIEIEGSFEKAMTIALHYLWRVAKSDAKLEMLEAARVYESFTGTTEE